MLFFFQARVKVDPDGNGAHIYAYTYKILKGKESGQFLHDFLWYAIIYFIIIIIHYAPSYLSKFYFIGLFVLKEKKSKFSLTLGKFTQTKRKV